MRTLLTALGVAAAIGLAGITGALPARAADSGCLSSGDAAEAVTTRKVVAPSEALGRVRSAVPSADILRASLCRDTDELVYRVTALRHDGRLVRVTVDAPSGKVRRVH